MNLKLLLADDHRMFREALRALLERNPEFEIVGETGDGNAIINLVRERSPDIVCLDIDLPGVNGVEITRRLAEAHPSVRVVALSVFSDRGYITDMLNAGAAAYVTKAAAGVELLRAIDAVSRNRSYLCPDATDAVREVLVGRNDNSIRLGARETEVLKLVATGLTSAQIAERMAIAQSTVEVHRRNIMRKLDVDSAIGLTRYAIRHGLVSSN